MNLSDLNSNLDAALADAERWQIKKYFRKEGQFARHLYPKHLDFFRAGATYRERLMLAANRIGKTESVGLYELVLHATGIYPSWWEGRRFDRPVRCWAAGDTKQTVREILQQKILGAVGNYGTGVLPGDHIHSIKKGGGSVPDSVEIINVNSRWGGVSQIVLKAYEQGRKAFQGTEQDVILLDEEPPLAVYTECLLRTMTNDGLILSTFTPLSGMSEVVMNFLPNGEVNEGEVNGRYVVTATWDDVPHLDEKTKDELYASIPPYQRDARSKGVPQLGSGAIYAIPESEITVADFKIPPHWPRVFGLDVGWNRTACIWLALDLETGIAYAYEEYYQGAKEPAEHTVGIRAHGDWIPGAIDPAARGRAQKDGDRLYEMYLDLGLPIVKAKNAVEAGIYMCWNRFSSGKLKIFKSLTNFFSEYRLYRRDEKGAIVKVNDHLMDALRYAVITGIDIAVPEPVKEETPRYIANSSWMG